jgi:hypothetical protein
MMKNMMLIVALFSLVVIRTESWAAQPPAEKRQTICLDGTWEVVEGKMDVMPKVFNHTVPVPGLLDRATPEFETPGNGIKSQTRCVRRFGIVAHLR